MFKFTTDLYLKEVAAIFGLVVLMHLAVLVYGWQISIGPWMLPSWTSIAVVIIAGIYAIKALSLLKKK